MCPYFKLPELVTLAEEFLKFIEDPQQKDYEHITPKLDDAIKRVNQIMTIYPKNTDR